MYSLYEEESRLYTHLPFCCHYAQDHFILHMKVISDGLEQNILFVVAALTEEKSVGNLENGQ